MRIFGAPAHGAASDIRGEGQRGPGLEPSDAGTWNGLSFLSRRFVIGSLIALGILVANALVSYRTIANLIEASRTVENTLQVVGALKDLQENVDDSEIELRGYIISGERDRLDRAQAFLGRAANLVQTLRAFSEVIPEQMQQVELLGALIGEESERFATLIETHSQKGVSAAIRTISATASAATTRRIQLITTDLPTTGNSWKAASDSRRRFRKSFARSSLIRRLRAGCSRPLRRAPRHTRWPR